MNRRSIKLIPVLSTLAAGALAPSSAGAQAQAQRSQRSASATLDRSPVPASSSITDTSSAADAVKRLRWRSVGPANNAGRVSVVVGVPGNRDVYYVSGSNGGIF